MSLSFENQVELVTGAASGMGLATAIAFANAGAAVTLARCRTTVSATPFATCSVTSCVMLFGTGSATIRPPLLDDSACRARPRARP